MAELRSFKYPKKVQHLSPKLERSPRKLMEIRHEGILHVIRVVYLSDPIDKLTEFSRTLIKLSNYTFQCFKKIETKLFGAMFAGIFQLKSEKLFWDTRNKTGCYSATTG